MNGCLCLGIHTSRYRLLCSFLVAFVTDAELLCAPNGKWFSAGDRHQTDPISVVADAVAAGCPQNALSIFKASTKLHWTNDTLCLYGNNSLWYQQEHGKREGGDSGVFGVLKYAKPCDSIQWENGPVWCRSTSTECFPPTPSPTPTPPLPPLNWTVFNVPATGVEFHSSHKELADMFAKGENLAASNIKTFMTTSAGYKVECMVEGEEYQSAWIETQPMAGAMYAQRNVRVAINNQLIFLRSARSDGVMAHRVDANPSGNFLKPVYFCGRRPGLQGLYMASPAVDVSFFLNLTASASEDSSNGDSSSSGGGIGGGIGSDAVAYLHELRSGLEAYDAWLWSHRNDSRCCALVSQALNSSCCPSQPSEINGSASLGLLWSSGVVDTGEDASDKFASNVVPIQSMDMMGYSHDTRRALARIARLLHDPATAAVWSERAAAVAETLKRALWRQEHGAFFDRDVEGAWVTTLVHNNIRLMWHGVMCQAHADAFVSRHLMNRSEFYTRMPLPSIAVSDPRFKNDEGNNWSGPPQGLTLQRAIRALETYGHHAESVLIGLRLTAALLPRNASSADSASSANGRSLGGLGKAGTKKPTSEATVGATVGGNFPQQIDPFTAVPQEGDGYGPMIMSLLEYTALRVGIVPRPERGMLWTGLQAEAQAQAEGEKEGGAHQYDYSQVLGPHMYHLVMQPNGSFTGARDGVQLFEAHGGLRVVTDLFTGQVTEVWGVADSPRQVSVSVTRAGAGLRHGSSALSQPAAPLQLKLAPNEEWSVSFRDGPPRTNLIRSTPFFPPFGG